MEEKKQSTRQMVYSMMAYNGASILGPLVFFGGIGWYLDKKFETGPLMLLISVAVAFVFTNIFLFRKVKKILKKFDNNSD